MKTFSEETRHKMSIARQNRTIQPNQGKKKSPEAKDKISKALKGHSITEEHKQKLINSHTEVTAKKISLANKGRKVSDETKQKISRSNTGKKRTIEFKQKRAEWAKKRKYSESSKRKMSESKKGHAVSDALKQRISRANRRENFTEQQLKIRASKIYLQRKLNGTMNTSTPEEELYKKLLKENVNKTIYRQYKDPKRYPYYCDFYIVEDDLFIELNAHWTHGGKPYDPNDPECQQKLAEWKEKAKTSKFYQSAINNWTIKDVAKLKCAIEHKLNYKVIY